MSNAVFISDDKTPIIGGQSNASSNVQPTFIPQCLPLTNVSRTLLAQRDSLALTPQRDATTSPVHSAPQRVFTGSVFVLCLLADLWRRGAAAFRVCPCLTVTWQSWMETPCAYLDSGRWRPWSEAGEFRRPAPSLSSPCATSTLTPLYPHCRESGLNSPTCR